MDWHFRVHQRMTDAEKRGQHRSWYVDELVRILLLFFLSFFLGGFLPVSPHRSPLSLPQDWIHTREAIDTDYTPPSQHPSSSHDHHDHTTSAHHHQTTTTSQPRTTTASGGGGGGAASSAGGAAAAARGVPYLPVPDDSSRVNTACPICQEKFEMSWLDEAQEWVWTDAVNVGGRVYHASCHREAAVPVAMPVLGKRKAEVCFL